MLPCVHHTSMELIKESLSPGSVTRGPQPGGGAQAVPRTASLGSGQWALARDCGPGAARPSYFPREAGHVHLPSFQS